MIYIALLRGINVGGNNKINMNQLNSSFVDAGFCDVLTYINSGNVIFSSSLDELAIQAICESMIIKDFGLRIAVVILTADEFLDALVHAPSWWGKASDSKHNAIFVNSSTTAEEVYTEVGEIKPEYEQCAYYGKLIFWSAPIKTFSQTRWASVSKRPNYQKITIRNANTAFKLVELIKKNFPTLVENSEE